MDNKIKETKIFFYRVCAEDNLSEICKKFNSSKENILRNNSQIPLYPGEIIKIKQNDYLVHFVKPAETLKDICLQYGKTEDELKVENNLQTEKLYIGQEIKIY